MSFHLPKNSKKGFTLIELLVVIAIIGILSSVVLASLSTARQKSRDSKRISDIGQVQLALELYFDANQSYPPAPSSPYGLPSVIVTNGYIPKLPVSPTGAAAYQYYGLSGANSNVNDTAGTSVSYVLAAQLERSDNTALTTDVDSIVINTSGSTVFDGTSVGCTPTGATAQPGGGTLGERCFDMHP